MKKLFGKAHGGIFEDGNGAHLRVAYGADQEACQIAISGKLTSKEVKALFARIVPEEERGKTGSDMLNCVGSACVEDTEYEKVILNITEHEAQEQVEPKALIQFLNPVCKGVATAEKTSFQLKNTQHP